MGRQPKGRGGRKYARWNAFGGKLDCHGTRALLLSHMQGVKPPCSLSLPTCHQLPLEGLVSTAHRVPDTGDKKAPSRVGLWKSIATVSGSCLSYDHYYRLNKDFPGSSEGKASACHAGDLGSISGSGRSPGAGNALPASDSFPMSQLFA